MESVKWSEVVMPDTSRYASSVLVGFRPPWVPSFSTVAELRPELKGLKKKRKAALVAYIFFKLPFPAGGLRQTLLLPAKWKSTA